MMQFYERSLKGFNCSPMKFMSSQSSAPQSIETITIKRVELKEWVKLGEIPLGSGTFSKILMNGESALGCEKLGLCICLGICFFTMNTSYYSGSDYDKSIIQKKSFFLFLN